MPQPLVSDTTVPVDDVLTVSDVTGEVGAAIRRVARDIWVRAEISEYKTYASGHHYFTVRDARAQMRCVMWKQDARRLATRPEVGMEVFLLGRASYWDEKGEFRFTVSTLIPTAAMGTAQQELERVRAALRADGLFEQDRKRPLPRYPAVIAVVTSPDGAALRDVVTVTRRRWPGTRILVVGCRVQGETAPAEVAAALRCVNRLDGVDLCIVGRGGGARDDLTCFNNEAVCRALAAVRVPTIAAIGHETDISLCDLVADHRAATPSAAAEAAVPDRREVERQVRELGFRVANGLSRRTRLAAERLARLQDRAQAALGQGMERRRHQIDRLGVQLDALSPLRVLERGYAVALDEQGRVLRRRIDFPEGRRFRLRVADGEVPSRVEDGGR
jgi:exodeoxyribonuclease VII large subunit